MGRAGREGRAGRAAELCVLPVQPPCPPRPLCPHRAASEPRVMEPRLSSWSLDGLEVLDDVREANVRRAIRRIKRVECGPHTGISLEPCAGRSGDPFAMKARISPRGNTPLCLGTMLVRSGGAFLERWVDVMAVNPQILVTCFATPPMSRCASYMPIERRRDRSNFRPSRAERPGSGEESPFTANFSAESVR